MSNNAPEAGSTVTRSTTYLLFAALLLSASCASSPPPPHPDEAVSSIPEQTTAKQDLKDLNKSGQETAQRPPAAPRLTLSRRPVKRRARGPLSRLTDDSAGQVEAPALAQPEDNEAQAKSPQPLTTRDDAASAIASQPLSNEADVELATKARAFLEKYCHDCHGKNGTKEGDLGFILDSARLVNDELIFPNEPDESDLYEKVERGRMPPKRYKKKPYEGPRPDEAEVEILRNWIKAGAPSFAKDIASSRRLITQSGISGLVQKDLETEITRAERRHQRYFTLSHLYSSGRSPEDLEIARMGLSKLLNSLSKAPKIVRPKAIDPEETIFRIDLRDLLWNTAKWETILLDYPYGAYSPDDPTWLAITRLTGTDLPIIRADWFVFQASRPPPLSRTPGFTRERYGT